MFTNEQLTDISSKISDCEIGIIGDFCVDIYWHADMTKSELSRETPHYPLPIIKEDFSLGAGGNVVANMCALKPKEIHALSIVGDDWRGTILKSLLKKSEISHKYLIEVKNRFTNAYCKPMRHGISQTVYEDARIDFDNNAPINNITEERVIENLRILAQKVKVLCVSDQFKNGIITDKIREEINLLANEGLTVVCDSRYNIEKYYNCILKPNELECTNAVNKISKADEDIVICAKALATNNNSTVFCTLGEKGAIITNGSDVSKIPAKKTQGEIDICGAGDTTLSAFSLALAVGLSLEKSAEFASIASAVTIKKLGTTGVATIEEMLDIQ